MLTISCPHCGRRDQTEFRAGGEADRTRPADPFALTDAEWADYLFMRRNVKGPQRERWVHAAGCGKWFSVTRDTRTHRFAP